MYTVKMANDKFPTFFSGGGGVTPFLLNKALLTMLYRTKDSKD